MRIVIVCAGAGCGQEYGAETGDATWICPSCSRTTPNLRYPFLTARLMQATIDAVTTDWRAAHDELLATAHDTVVDREGVIARRIEEVRALREENKALRQRLRDLGADPGAAPREAPDGR